VILLDDSESMKVQISSEIRNVKRFLIDSTWGERDRVSILAFSGLHPVAICLGNCNTQLARVSLNTLRADGSTPLYDALVQATEILKKNRDPEYRLAIILFSDGVDTISIHSANDALQAAQNLQASIYTVNSRSKAAAPGSGDAILTDLAVSTGGVSFSSERDVNEALHMILEDLHSGYELTYELPEKMPGQHSVRVLPTRDPHLKFRSRQAYDYLGDR
jgi:VWFA-related protein